MESIPETEKEQFQHMVNQYKDTVYKIAFTYSKNKADADDLFQEVFLQYLKSKPAFENKEHEKAWFIRVTINKSKNLLSSAWFKKSQPLDDVFVFEAKEDSELFYAVLALPEKYRIAIHLYYYEDYSIKEIAKLTGTKETTIQTRLQRARSLLKVKLERSYSDEQRTVSQSV
ncbi:sigma-70 family RNA polymerase sigma factor [Paludicola sp. MB14-C6]|uniref:sigma-70 family RNA polymerase sigma factor n=1 Tax=Paludihabitans sp. MB14-C6 TaxID=3070656 RepID=UPI0027DC30C9|nr:sigma-70 family RNA polymerase sigma factor [Paludicola sp. MB14-C6]WMJ22278.1 sigma-70 family RNA polymerase sigma factor [Paludicola sp. MB14-C6]